MCYPDICFHFHSLTLFYLWNWLKCYIVIHVTDFPAWGADGYQCQTVQLTRWVMAVLPFNIDSVICHLQEVLPAAASTWPHTVTLRRVFENTWRQTLVFDPHPSITAPLAHVQLWIGESGLHLTWTSSPTSDELWELWSKIPLMLVWPNMATWSYWWMHGVCGQWPTWMLACDWWLHPSLQCHYLKDIK